MKKIYSELKIWFIKLLLPWIATVVTALPYTDRYSRFLDRLLVIAEGN